MEAVKTELEGVILLKPNVYPDSRGYFYESFNVDRYKDAGINFPFVQDNISRSVKGTIRGLHYQIGEFAQGKLCQVVFGKVLDVAVDIRFGSPTFGKYYAVELSDENNYQLWIPPGFAHGFSVLSDEAVFSYKCTALYSKKDERSIIFNDQDINVDWKTETPVISEKDLQAKKFNEIEKDFIY
ncbi:MAG: dTDP-4-dehydrorhamnose 3,5-epimerase [Rhodothermaceae bacterium]